MQYQVEAIQAEVTKQQQETEADLAKAEPALQAANAALNTLNRVCICVCTSEYMYLTIVWGLTSVCFVFCVELSSHSQSKRSVLMSRLYLFCPE